MSWWGLLRSPFATVGFIADIAVQSAAVNRASGAFFADRLAEAEEADEVWPEDAPYLNWTGQCIRCGNAGDHTCLRDVPGVPPAPGNDPAGVEQLPPVPPAGIDFDRLAGGPW